MSFEIIDIENRNRRESFEHYFSGVPCTYSMTVKLDITKIRVSGQKLYPTILYHLTQVINRHAEFRMGFDDDGRLGVYHELIPRYTVFHKDTETFSNIWTEFHENYDVFCTEFQRDVEMYGDVKRMEAKPGTPKNTFSVSMIPWETFDGFHLNLQKGYRYLPPIFTLGKYYEENERVLLPLAIQVHHAVCDGFHVCRLIQELRDRVE